MYRKNPVSKRTSGILPEYAVYRFSQYFFKSP